MHEVVWDGDRKRDTANERHRVAGGHDGVLAMLCCRVVRPHALLITVTVNWQDQKGGDRAQLYSICAGMQNRMMC